MSVVYRSIPTSNRNKESIYSVLDALYIVLFLHQTATSCQYLLLLAGCISFYSYIKPQHANRVFTVFQVVYRSIPTSNRNIILRLDYVILVVYRSIPTSNRNPFR